MKIRSAPDAIHIELSVAEAHVLHDELAHVRGGARLPKLRQVCSGLEALFVLLEPEPKPVRSGGRPPGRKSATN